MNNSHFIRYSFFVLLLIGSMLIECNFTKIDFKNRPKISNIFVKFGPTPPY